MTPQGRSAPIGSLSGTHQVQRKPALSVLHTILGLLDREILHRKALEWVIGGPLVRMERARLQADYCGAALTSEERAGLRDVLDAYERVFEAVGQAQRSRGRTLPDGVTLISAEIRRDFESARRALQTLFETFAQGDA
jgi:hypothetical protein